MISAQRAHESTGGGRSALPQEDAKWKAKWKLMMPRTLQQFFWICPAPWRTLGDLSSAASLEHASFQPGMCTLILGWSKILSTNTFKIDLQLLWWHNHTRMSGNWMVYFPSSSHTGQNVQIEVWWSCYCLMNYCTLPDMVQEIMSWSLPAANEAWLSFLTINAIHCKVGVCVCTVIIWQWILLSCCPFLGSYIWHNRQEFNLLNENSVRWHGL